MSKNDDYTTGNLLDHLYHRNYYQLISIDLSRQINATIPEQINSEGKLEEGNGATMFSSKKNNKKTILKFSLDSLIVTE